MKKAKILSIILGIALVIVMATSLVACNDACTEHVDENNDLKCDNCEADMSSVDDGNGNGGNDGTTTPSDKETYTFTLKDQNNAGVPGVEVQVLVDGTAGEIKATDTNGNVSFAVKKDAVLVQVTVLEWNDLYVNDLDSETISFINTKSIVIDGIVKKTEYAITVVDNLGAAVEGVQVQLCFGTVCKTPKMTSKAGKATILATEDGANAYVSINSLPTGYALQNGGIINDGIAENYTKYTNWEGSSIKIVVDKLNVVTISVGDLFGSVFADIEISIYKTADDSFVTSGITSVDGTVEFVLPVGQYYFRAEHKDGDPTYTWLRHEEGMQEIDGSNVTTTFVHNDMVNYVFNVTRTDSDAFVDGLTIQLLNRLYESVSIDSEGNWAEATVENGVATISAPYDSYYVKVLGLGENSYYPVTKIEKTAGLTYDIVINDDIVVGSVNNPIALTYGSNDSYDLAEMDILYFTLANPSGASLKIEANVKVIVNNQEYTQVDGVVTAPLGTNDEVIIELVALEDIQSWAWGIEVLLTGTQNAPEMVFENDLTNGNKEIDVDLSLGARYYQFNATTAQTLTLSSTDDVKFFVDGQETSSVAIDVDGNVTIKVIGEGEATVNFNYAEKLVKYMVSVTKENDFANGIIVDLIYQGESIAMATTVDGHAIFENVKEYPTYSIFATVQEANIPVGYTARDVNAVFTYELMYNADEDRDEGVYTAAYGFELIRDGSQNAPYLWHSEGIQGMPTEIEVEIEAGETLYYDFFGYIQAVNLPEYFIYVMGNVDVKIYKDIDDDGEIDFDSFDIATFDETKNATWVIAPINYTVIIAVSATEDATLTLKCKEGYVPDMSSGEEAAPSADGSKQFPFTLVAGEITTPNFVPGTSMADPGIQNYFYTFTATETCTITIIAGENAWIQIERANMAGDYEGPITLEAGESMTLIAMNEMYQEAAVTFTVSIA